jgi:hypothetical protein
VAEAFSQQKKLKMGIPLDMEFSHSLFSRGWKREKPKAQGKTRLKNIT